MRLAQAAGVAGTSNATFVPTYDLSCPFGVDTPPCPLGSVHNLNKTLVAARAARAMLAEIDPAVFPPPGASPPLVTGVTAAPVGQPSSGSWRITVAFNAAPLALRDTQYCVTCCAGATGEKGGGDFDVSADGGATWVNGTAVALVSGGEVAFAVTGLAARPAMVRYTANQAFPQCAVVALANSLPAAPFSVGVTAGGSAAE